MSTRFRPSAVAGLSRSQRLDEPVRIVRISSWVALALALLLLAAFGIWMFVGTVAVTVQGQGVINNAPANTVIRAPSGGVVVEEIPPVGSLVRKGQVIARIDEAGTEADLIAVRSPVDGTIMAVGGGTDSAIEYGQYLATIAPRTDKQVGYLFLPAGAGDQVQPGMRALLAPRSVDSSAYGLLLGTVKQVSPLPASASRVDYITGEAEYSATLLSEGPVVEVLVELTPDPSSPSGWSWSRPPGPSDRPVSGIPTDGKIVLDQVRPYRAFWGAP